MPKATTETNTRAAQTRPVELEHERLKKVGGGSRAELIQATDQRLTPAVPDGDKSTGQGGGNGRDDAW